MPALTKERLQVQRVLKRRQLQHQRAILRNALKNKNPKEPLNEPSNDVNLTAVIVKNDSLKSWFSKVFSDVIEVITHGYSQIPKQK